MRTYSERYMGIARYYFFTLKQDPPPPPRNDNTLLRINLTNYKDAVGVPMSPGYLLRLPPIVILVLYGSSFWGRISHTTFVWHTSMRRSPGISLYLITCNVSVPATLFFLGTLSPLPIPWQIRPRSLH